MGARKRERDKTTRQDKDIKHGKRKRATTPQIGRASCRERV